MLLISDCTPLSVRYSVALDDWCYSIEREAETGVARTLKVIERDGQEIHYVHVLLIPTFTNWQ